MAVSSGIVVSATTTAPRQFFLRLDFLSENLILLFPGDTARHLLAFSSALAGGAVVELPRRPFFRLRRIPRRFLCLSIFMISSMDLPVAAARAAAVVFTNIRRGGSSGVVGGFGVGDDVSGKADVDGIPGSLLSMEEQEEGASSSKTLSKASAAGCAICIIDVVVGRATTRSVRDSIIVVVNVVSLPLHGVEHLVAVAAGALATASTVTSVSVRVALPPLVGVAEAPRRYPTSPTVAQSTA